jgi:hypothetical protein
MEYIIIMLAKQNYFAKSLLIFQNILQEGRMDTVLKKRNDSSGGGKEASCS